MRQSYKGNVCRKLFNAAFVAMWTALDEAGMDLVSSQLSRALSHSDNADIVQTILNLAEFMDHSEKVTL